MQFQVQLAVLACALSLAACTQDLSATYPFKATLNTAENGGLYELYWTFDNAAENISFAVRVQTTGWVGFGISPNGQMPNSDVVIGWVDNGQTFFHVSFEQNVLVLRCKYLFVYQDRFATSRSPPSVDEQQDWTLVDGEEEGGFTVLEFTRKYITCDNKDLPITVSKISACIVVLFSNFVHFSCYFLLPYRVRQHGLYGVFIPLLILPLKTLHLARSTATRDQPVSTYWEDCHLQLLIQTTFSTMTSKWTELVPIYILPTSLAILLLICFYIKLVVSIVGEQCKLYRHNKG